MGAQGPAGAAGCLRAPEGCLESVRPGIGALRAGETEWVRTFGETEYFTSFGKNDKVPDLRENDKVPDLRENDKVPGLRTKRQSPILTPGGKRTSRDKSSKSQPFGKNG